MDTTEVTHSTAAQTITPVPAPLLQSSTPTPEEDDDFSDDPEVIFRREWSKLDTAPLTEPVPVRVYVLLSLFIASFVVGSVLSLLTYPTVTVTITPIAKTITATMALALPTHQLAPVTLTQSRIAPTTGHGHQNAQKAVGSVTFYNGLSIAQSVPAGTFLAGSDGEQIITDQAAFIPPNAPPEDGSVTVPAHALYAGAQGNIAVDDVSLALSSSLTVKNLRPFTGGQDARDFSVVARADLDALTHALQAALVANVPQAFHMQQDESVSPIDCQFTTTTDHRVGEEATTITMTATETCKGMAYRQDDLQQQATAVFSKQTRPDATYELLRTTVLQIVSVTPLLVRMSGTWVYLLTPDYQDFLAEQVAGETPGQAQKYLLGTGFITKASIPAQLPKDPGHIHFLMLIRA